MKKTCFFLIILALFTVLVFGDEGKQEEVDFLLFRANSGDQFTDGDQASVQLDKLANFLKAKNLIPGQIHVFGYAAAVVNDIESTDLSRDRAVFVINELQKRGVGNNLFADPVGYGETAFWGANDNEEDRSPNRRVRIMLDEVIITPEILREAEPEIIITVNEIQEKEPVRQGSGLLWKILLPLILLALLALIILLLLKKRKRVLAAVMQESPVLPVPVPVTYTTVNLDDAIRFHAFELSLWRNCMNGDMDGDWFKSVCEISARYEADGYQVYTENGSWWAKKAN